MAGLLDWQEAIKQRMDRTGPDPAYTGCLMNGSHLPDILNILGQRLCFLDTFCKLLYVTRVAKQYF